MTRTELVRNRAFKSAWVRLALSLLLLIATLAWLDPERLWERFRSADPLWLLVALSAASLCYPLLAARWSFLSARAGASLRFEKAIREYYVSTLLNQLLPLGVAGDAWRVKRRLDEERSDEPRRGALAALFSDRVSGQLVLWLWVLLALPSLGQSSSSPPGGHLGVALALLVALALALLLSARLREGLRTSAALLLAPGSAAVHVPLSAGLIALHVATFWASARALALDLDVSTACELVPLILCAGSLPAFFAGWGVRELAAAGLYHLSGRSSGDGASASLLFGIVSLVASAPGIFLVSRSPSAELGERA